MKTVKEIKLKVDDNKYTEGYYYGYKDSIEQIYSEIRNAKVVEDIEDFLYDLMTK